MFSGHIATNKIDVMSLHEDGSTEHDHCMCAVDKSLLCMRVGQDVKSRNMVKYNM